MKQLVWFGLIAGSTIGGFIPSVWGDGVFSFSSVICAAIGGFAGIWLGYKISQ